MKPRTLPCSLDLFVFVTASGTRGNTLPCSPLTGASVPQRKRVSKMLRGCWAAPKMWLCCPRGYVSAVRDSRAEQGLGGYLPGSFGRPRLVGTSNPVCRVTWKRRCGERGRELLPVSPERRQLSSCAALCSGTPTGSSPPSLCCGVSCSSCSASLTSGPGVCPRSWLLPLSRRPHCQEPRQG